MSRSMNLGFSLLVAAALALPACGSSGSKGGTGGHSGGTGGAGGSTVDAGGLGGAGGAGDAGTDDAGANPRDEHLRIINKQTTGGLPVTGTPPIAYETCKI